MSTVERDGIKDSRYLQRIPLPEVKLAPSERFLRSLGLLPVKTIIAGNTQNIADRVYKARGPAAMKAHRAATNAYYDELARQGTGNPILSVIQEKGTAIQQEGTAIQQEGQTVGAPAARITATDIYWGYHQPSKPEEIIWGGHIFLGLSREQQETISRLSNSIRSGDSTAVNVNNYKIALDNLITLNGLTYDTVNTTVSNKSMSFSPDLIKTYWNRYNRFDYIIETDEIYFFIFDWISKNTIFIEEPYIIFPSAVSDLIRNTLEESRIPPPEPDSYPEFNERKRKFIRRLYYSPNGESQSILDSFMDQEEQNIFKPRLMGELDLRETRVNTIYEFADGAYARRMYPNIVLEDCKLLWYQLTRITQRMRKLYPIYREEEVYEANQSHSIIDFFLQKKLFSEFDKKYRIMTEQERRSAYCTNSALFFENTAQGNCGLDSIAQIYAPYDITEAQQFYQYTAPISIRLRELLTRAYAKAHTNIPFRTSDGNGFNRDGIITEIDGTQRNFQEYAEYISHDRTWLADDDIKILMWLLGKIPYAYIAPSIENQQDINVDFGKNRIEYTICNLDGRHWRLKKGGERRNWDNDLLHAENILRLSGEEIIRLEEDEGRRPLPREPREVVDRRVAAAAQQALPESPEAEAQQALPASPEAAAQQRLPLTPEASAAESAIAASGIVGIESQAAAVASVFSAPEAAAPEAPRVSEITSTKLDFNILTQQIKLLAITYRTTEFECFTAIEYLHKVQAKRENKMQGGSKTRKNKRKQ